MTPPNSPMVEASAVKFPEIGPKDSFVQIVKTLSVYFIDEIDTPSTFDQLRTTSAGNKIRILVEHLVMNVTNPALINALLTLKWHFSILEADDRALNETRASACEIVAWRFLSRISEQDAVNFCLYELPQPTHPESTEAVDAGDNVTEISSLLPQFRARESIRPGTSSTRVDLLRSVSHMGDLFAHEMDGEDDEEDPTSSFTGLNGLEIAAVADWIWKGDITFWEKLSANTKKKPQFYNRRYSDAFTRLRVPRYIKAFEVLFFATFLVLYYAVLIERNPYHITPFEVMLYIWLASFAYEELGEFIDAGSIFYAVDIWNGCDLFIILIGAVFLVTRTIGLVKDSDKIIDISFDILSLEALFMVPRICSLLSLHPYFGTLIPCLKAMARDFVKFMVVVAVLYMGFLTTFTLLARDTFTLSEMSWILIKVFFGSSYLGFDIMNDISPQLGPPLMLIFVCMTNILLITSLISILSDSFSKVIAHARDEYLFVYSVYVLEASTSNRLTHFYPPLNLFPLIFIRPLRLFISSEKLRSIRIVVLKITHLPIVAAIFLFETIHAQIKGGGASTFSSTEPSFHLDPTRNIRPPRPRPRPFLSSRANTTKTSQHFPTGDGPSSPKIQTGKEIKHPGMVVVDTNIPLSLEKKVDGLNEKIAELTALIMAQQGLPPSDDSAGEAESPL